METELKRVAGKERIWELDFLRGIALILMIYFHIMYDLQFFFGMPISISTGFNYAIGKISVILFILLSGISSRFSRNILRHGVMVLAIAFLLTVVTELADLLVPVLFHQPSPSVGIRFGILHMLGICMVLSPLLEKIKPAFLFLLSLLIILAGIYMSQLTVSPGYLFPFGLMNSSFYSSDYYPLFPWAGLFTTGAALGRLLYSKKRSLLPFRPGENPVNTVGRHTLLIYLLHQPIILGILGIYTLLFK